MELSDIGCRYKQIIDYPDYYITELGDVYSTRLRGFEKQKRLRKLKPKDPGNESKYLNIILCNDDGQFTKSIHRLVAEYFVDGFFDGAVVNHKDGNNRNNRYDNLEWTTQKDNIHKSYVTSGIDQTRNVITWCLYDPSGTLITEALGHNTLESYVKNNNINASPTGLTRNLRSNGYTVIKR